MSGLQKLKKVGSNFFFFYFGPDSALPTFSLKLSPLVLRGTFTTMQRGDKRNISEL